MNSKHTEQQCWQWILAEPTSVIPESKLVNVRTGTVVQAIDNKVIFYSPTGQKYVLSRTFDNESARQVLHGLAAELGAVHMWSVEGVATGVTQDVEPVRRPANESVSEGEKAN